jgi:hypothetical protein
LIQFSLDIEKRKFSKLKILFKEYQSVVNHNANFRSNCKGFSRIKFYMERTSCNFWSMILYKH